MVGRVAGDLAPMAGYVAGEHAHRQDAGKLCPLSHPCRRGAHPQGRPRRRGACPHDWPHRLGVCPYAARQRQWQRRTISPLPASVLQQILTEELEVEDVGQSDISPPSLPSDPRK